MANIALDCGARLISRLMAGATLISRLMAGATLISRLMAGAKLGFCAWRQRDAWILRLMAERCFNFLPDGWCDAWILRLMPFLFLRKATVDGFGLRRRGCGRNDEKDYSSKVIQMICFALLLLRLLASFHSEKRSLARAVGGLRFPPKFSPCCCLQITCPDTRSKFYSIS